MNLQQDNLDFLVVNTQCVIGLQGYRLVKMLKTGDMSAQAYAGRFAALHSLMKAAQDTDITTTELTDEKLRTIVQKINYLSEEQQQIPLTVM